MLNKPRYVIDRVSYTFAIWKDSHANQDRDLAAGGDRLAVGKVLHGGDKVVRRVLVSGMVTMRLLSLLWTFYAGVLAEEEEDEPSSIIEVMAWCKGVIQGLDWPQVLRLAKKECNLDAGDDELLRIGCSENGLVAALDGTRAILEMSQLQRLVCPNGQIFLLAVTLAYAREQLSLTEVSQAQANNGRVDVSR
eukprot:symbB.v1.2.009223.t1/scaffold582.1/size184522/9